MKTLENTSNSQKQVMTVCRTKDLNHIQEIGEFRVVQAFIYLGLVITNKGNCETEIKCRLAKPRNPTVNLTKIWKDFDIEE